MSVIKDDQKSEGRISMFDNRINRPAAGALMLIALSISLPACNAPGGPPPPLVRSPDGSTPTTNRFSLRPILDGEGGRPYYIGGYAGASYGPGLFSRRSTVGTPVIQPSGPPSVTVNQGTWEPE
jgi:hypothetical protein